MLWWEGIPSALRGRVWALVIGDPLGLAETEGPRRPSGGPGFSAYERHLTMATAADEKAAEAAISREWEALGLTGEGREELRMFTAAGSPMHLALVQLLTAVYAYTRAGGPAPTSHSSLLAAMLLLYCDGAGAFVCLAALLRDHFVGVRPDAHAQWRMRAGGAVISKELPELDAHLPPSASRRSTTCRSGSARSSCARSRSTRRRASGTSISATASSSRGAPRSRCSGCSAPRSWR